MIASGFVEAVYDSPIYDSPMITLVDVQRALRLRLSAHGSAMPDWADDRYPGQRLLHLHTDDPEMPMLVRRYFNRCSVCTIMKIHKCKAFCVKELGQERAQQVYDAYKWVKHVNEEDHPLPEDEPTTTSRTRAKSSIPTTRPMRPTPKKRARRRMLRRRGIHRVGRQSSPSR